MQLKEIKLSGFKSFVDKTVIKILEDTVAIVGPNGCGKSNIIDAVRWVLGEKSAKNLRGSTMTDVIFAGSSSRKPVGQAIVELIFDNSLGKCHGIYQNVASIAVRRVVNSDGVSNYYLNQTKCRRRDVAELFMGTGLSSNSYAVVEQGMVNDLIGSKPEDIKLLIDEAAGISRYKERRRESMSKLNHTLDNLEKVASIKLEVSALVEKLGKQAKVAIEYKNLAKKIESLTISILLTKLCNANKLAESLAEQYSERKLALQDLLKANTKFEIEFVAQQQKLHALDKSEDECQENLYQSKLQLQRHEHTKSQKDSKLSSLRHKKSELTEIVDLQKEKSRQLQAELEGCENQLQVVGTDLQSANNSYEEVLVTYENCKKETKELRYNLSHKQQSLQKSLHEFQLKQERLGHLRHRKQSLAVELEQNQQQQDLLIDKNQLSKSKELEVKKVAVVDRVSEHQNKIKGHQAEIKLLKDNIKQQQQKVSHAKQQCSRLEGQLNSIEGLLSTHSKSKAKSSEHAKSILAKSSKLAVHFQVDPKFSSAIGSYLNDWIDSVWVEKVDNANTLLDLLKDAGKIVWQPLLDNHFCLGSELVRTKLNYNLPFSNKLYTADSLFEAWKLLSNIGVHDVVLCEDGTILGHGFAAVQKSNTTLNYVSQQQKLKKELDYAVAEVSRAESILIDLEKNLDISLEQEVELNNNLQSAREDLVAINASLQSEMRAKKEQENLVQNLLTRARVLRQEEQKLEREQLEIDSFLQSDPDSHLVDKEIIIELEQKLAAFELRLTELEQDLNSKLQMKNDADLAAHKIKMQYKQTKETLSSNLELMQENMQKLDKILLDLSGDKYHTKNDVIVIANLSKKIEELGAQLNSLQINIAEQKNKLGKVELEQKQAQDSSKKLEVEVAKLEHKHSSCLKDVVNFEEELQQHSPQSVQSLMQNLELIDLNIANQEVLEATKAREKLGAVNLAAIDDYKEQQQKLDYLTEQEKDLSTAVHMLKDIIAKIDIESERCFKDTFTKVQENFSELFPVLFRGGTAKLSIVGEEKEGVKIVAYPPGKKPSSLYLLSGGEKTLCAVAFIFAIFKLNPAPFCLLDEIDAPLDEANVLRFADLLTKMSSDVQFILVTHNKNTMQIAKQLVGITMKEPGVSRAVGVQMQDLLATLDS